MVGISLLTLVPGLSGGSETYARELCRALGRVGGLRYRVFLPEIATDAADGLPWTIVGRYRSSRSMPGRIAAMSLAAARAGALRRDLEVDRLDAIHFPLSIMLPPVGRPAAATTVLDLQHEEHPEFFGRAELAYRRVVYGWTIKRSRIVITISEHARQTLLERHRLEAFGLLRRERPGLRLVLTGEGDYGTLPDGVEARGRVSTEALADLYRRAAALVFPSLYEGFGMPLVEAMACGCPVASSNATSLPEVAGGAARLFDPRDPEDIAGAVDDVLRDPDPWIARGLERAQAFTWDACALAHDDVYRELSSG